MASAFFKAAASTVKKVAVAVAVPDLDDDGDAGGLMAARAILEDHRALLPPPHTVPQSICDAENFPFYPPAEGWTEGADPTAAAQRNEAVRVSAYIKDDWIRHQMQLKEAIFTQDAPCSVHVGTYNTNGKKPGDCVIEPWVCAPEGRGAPPPDVCVFGFQEIVDLNVQNAVSDTLTKERSALWIDLIQRALNGWAKRAGVPEGYELMASRSLVGIMVCAFILRRRVANVRNVQTAVAATGVMGVVGNKGACAIRFELNDSSFCFVCAHLAAHADAVENRNSDYRQIMAKTSFKMDPPTASRVPEKHHSRIAATTPDALLRGELFISEHDFLIWLGDFNYRIDASKSAEEVLSRINKGDVEWLYSHDQLRKEMEAGRVFTGLAEVDRVTGFLPTYKFESGTDMYDQRPEKKLRAPAWTDRILWQPMPGSKCFAYERVDALRLSDHKPVEATLLLMGRVVDEARRQASYHEVLRRLDVPPSALGALVTVSPIALDFGAVVYRRKTPPQTILVRNAGAVPLTFRFAPRPGDNALCAPWLTLRPAYGMLLPGDEATVHVEVELGAECARSAVSQRLFADVLDLRVHGVVAAEPHTLATHHLLVQATLLPTCFGAHLASLTWAPLPVRLHGSGEVQGAQRKGAAPQAMPKELWRLLDALQATPLDAYRLFLEHADPEEVAGVREALDTGAPIVASQHALALALLEFIDTLKEPVVPVELVPDASELSSPSLEEQWASGFIMQLPTVNANVLGCLIGLARLVLSRSAKNHLDLDLLAPVFAEVVFRPSEASEANRENAAAEASGLGEFATWLTGSSAGKASDLRADKAAVTAFCALVRGTL